MQRLQCSAAQGQGCKQCHTLVQVHFDCIYKGIDVVSSRQARLLGGNRTISEARGFNLSCKSLCSACQNLAHLFNEGCCAEMVAVPCCCAAL
jgi:hypothetical protein